MSTVVYFEPSGLQFDPPGILDIGTPVNDLDAEDVRGYLHSEDGTTEEVRIQVCSEFTSRTAPIRTIGSWVPTPLEHEQKRSVPRPAKFARFGTLQEIAAHHLYRQIESGLNIETRDRMARPLSLK